MSSPSGAWVYILECADGSFYTGLSKRQDLGERVGEHQGGTFKGYTFKRRPVRLVWSQWFPRLTDAIAMERKVKGWSRLKKIALIEGRLSSLKALSKRKKPG